MQAACTFSRPVTASSFSQAIQPTVPYVTTLPLPQLSTSTFQPEAQTTSYVLTTNGTGWALQIRLVRTGTGPAWVYVGGTKNKEARDDTKLPKLPHGVHWHTYDSAAGTKLDALATTRSCRAARVMVVTHGLTFKDVNQYWTAEEAFVASTIEEFTIMAVSATVGYDPSDSSTVGTGYFSVMSNISVLSFHRCVQRALWIERPSV